MKHSKFELFDQYNKGRWQLQFYSLPLWQLKGRVFFNDEYRAALSLPFASIAYTKPGQAVEKQYERYEPRPIAQNMTPWKAPAPAQEWEAIN